jgi:hypothetical protein
MADDLSNYLERFKAYLKIDATVKSDVAEEIHTYLEDKTQELKERGLGEGEAAKVAIQSLGSSHLIAEQMYQVHGQGTWQEAFFAALPHFLVVLLLISYYWQNIACPLLILATIACVVAYGWWHGKPIWLFPWLGYYLLPVILSGILLIDLAQGWAWLATLAYVPLALFAIVCIVKQAAARDWLYVSLIFIPLPVVLGWLLALDAGNGFSTINIQLAQLQVDIPWIAISFAALAIATIVCIRVRQRCFKTLALLIPPIVILASVALISGGSIGFWGWFILILSLLALVSPTWLQLKS